MLADYSSSEFQTTMQTLNPPVKKCTLIFDENGDVVATLEPDVEKRERWKFKREECKRYFRKQQL